MLMLMQDRGSASRLRIKLPWSAKKSNYNKTPAADRSKGRACVDLLLTCVLEQSDVSEFIRLPGSYTHACLRSAREFILETHRKTEDAK